MNLADRVQQGDEAFKLTLNYGGKYTFAQEACRFRGSDCHVRDVMDGDNDFFIVSEPAEKCSDIFRKFDSFVENLKANSEPGQYSAVLVSRPDRLMPVAAIDHNGSPPDIQTVVVLFGKAGGEILFGFESGDVRQEIRNMIASKEDLSRLDAWLVSRLGEPKLKRVGLGAR